MVAAHRFRSLGAGTSANLESGATYEKESDGASEELRQCGSNRASLNAFVVRRDNLAAKRVLRTRSGSEVFHPLVFDELAHRVVLDGVIPTIALKDALRIDTFKPAPGHPPVQPNSQRGCH